MPRFTLVGTAKNMTGRSDCAELLALKSRIWATFVPHANRRRDSRGPGGLRICTDARSSEVLMSRSCCFSGRAFLLIACVWGICRARTNSFGNGVATISHFSYTAADCYSVVARFNSLDALEVID
jgi:hypothetical protein